MKQPKNKPNLRLAILGFIFLSVLVLGGKYAQRNNNNFADSRFLDGVAFAFTLGKNAQPTPTPEPAQNLSEREEIENFGQALFGDSWITFKRIIWCESKWNTQAVSKTGDVGLTQISWVHSVSPRWLKKWRVNLVVAYELFKEQGLSPWKYSSACWGGGE